MGRTVTTLNIPACMCINMWQWKAQSPGASAVRSKVTFDLTADAPGDWAFHCHMLMHMHAGMFNVVTVRPLDGAAS